MNRIRYWLARKALEVVAQTDYSIKKGDEVTSPGWALGPLFVVDVNWALMAAAIKLGETGAIVIWPIWLIKKV